MMQVLRTCCANIGRESQTVPQTANITAKAAIIKTEESRNRGSAQFDTF
jgi:hypothetical protein